MALKLVIKGTKSFYKVVAKDGTESMEPSADTTLSIETNEPLTARMDVINVENDSQTYELSILKLSFQKKMYQPTSVKASILISSIETKDGEEEWHAISKETIQSLFENKQVALYSGGDSVGDDFYVQGYKPCYKSNSMIVLLDIYSLDNLLTLEHTSRTYVSKKLGDGILNSVLPKKPYKASEQMAYDITNMKMLAYTKKLDLLKNKETKEYESKEINTEHIFPYLVQYNESVYDMLARTCNRWGEFMYYENGKLNIGYVYDQKKVKTINSFNKLTYVDLDEVGLGDNFDRAADSDDNMTDSQLKKSPKSIKNNFLLPLPDKDYDKAVMKKLTQVFKNEKSIPTFLGNQLFDDSYDLAKKAISVEAENSEFDGKYFTDDLRNADPEKFNGDHSSFDKFNLFTEFKEEGDTFDYSNAKYKTILKNERIAAKNAVCIDFDTTYPGLKLGEIISVYGVEYIVSQIDCMPRYQQRVLDNMWVIDNNDTPSLFYQIIATARHKDGDAYNFFYPSVLPTGHVRYADPQMAEVTDAKDPVGDGRVRVLFPWQSSSDDATPWLQFTANAGGQKGLMGMHYKGDKVFVGFVNGNVERPYVLGAISQGAGADVDCATPGGHVLKLSDDAGGIMNFLTGMFLPGWGTLSDFIPGFGDINPFSDAKNNLALAGGFELSDKYGIYKISGSTDSREVNVASPWGEVNINAFTGITISAPNGNVSIKGKNVSIEAGNNLELISGTNVKYKLVGDDGVSGFFEDIGIAVAKKVVESLSTLVTVDLSIIRSVFEIVMRPTEGKLLVKSNRYLMLESGKGECDYPATAYKDDATVQKLIKKAADKDLRPGLKLSSGVTEMISKVNTFGNEIDKTYIEKYNRLVELRRAYDEYIEKKDCVQWANNYVNGTEMKICKKAADLVSQLWATNENLLTVTDLGFDDSKFGTDPSKVNDDVKNVYDAEYPTLATRDLADKKKDICSTREYFRGQIKEKANELRKAIIDFQKFQKWSDERINPFLVFKDVTVPKAFKKAFTKALAAENVNESFYFKEVVANKKKLENKYDTLATPFAKDRKVLKRKVAIKMLEEMGFQDEWRQKIDDPTWHPSVPPIPGEAAPKILAPKPSSDDDLSNKSKWESYVDSVIAVPKMSADQWKITKELKKVGDSLKENYTGIYNSAKETLSWGDAKHGAILFSSGESVYSLAENIQESPTPWKENLTTDDDTAPDTSVQTFLDGVRRKMKSLD